MKILFLFLPLSMMTGCANNTPTVSLTDPKSNLLDQARRSLEEGKFFDARQMVETVLKKHPHDAEAERLMSEIMDQEIARQKMVFEADTVEDLTSDEKVEAVKTWLERGESFLNLRQYDEALLAAEKVFLYDPQNIKASQMIDRIKQQAYREGKADGLILNQMVEGEIQERISRYRQQAKDWIQIGRWGAARLAVEKILLLMPEDPEALKLYEKIKQHRRPQGT